MEKKLRLKYYVQNQRVPRSSTLPHWPHLCSLLGKYEQEESPESQRVSGTWLETISRKNCYFSRVCAWVWCTHGWSPSRTCGSSVDSVRECRSSVSWSTRTRDHVRKITNLVNDTHHTVLDRRSSNHFLKKISCNREKLLDLQSFRNILKLLDVFQGLDHFWDRTCFRARSASWVFRNIWMDIWALVIEWFFLCYK